MLDVFKIIGDDIEDRGGVWGGECGRERAPADFSNLLLVEARRPFSEIKVPRKRTQEWQAGRQPQSNENQWKTKENQWKTNGKPMENHGKTTRV